MSEKLGVIPVSQAGPEDKGLPAHCPCFGGSQGLTQEAELAMTTSMMLTLVTEP